MDDLGLINKTYSALRAIYQLKLYPRCAYTHFLADMTFILSVLHQLGNLTNPHWQSEKKLDFDKLTQMGVKGIIASWVHTSDENAALQFLPNAGAPGNGSLYNVPALYVGNSTGELLRGMLASGQVKAATVVLDAPSYVAPTKTVVGRLPGLSGGDESILLYTHSEHMTTSRFLLKFRY